MTGRPAALSALALASTARVADSEMADTRADILVVGMRPWCHLPWAEDELVSPPGGPGGTRSGVAGVRGPGRRHKAAEGSRGSGGRSPGQIPRPVRREGSIRRTLWWLQSGGQ